jgi:metallo-beta-lactamase family protein
VTSADSIALNTDKTPKIIISASGMCEAGRIRHHLKHNLWRSESTILFVGYQSAGTLGNKLLGGASKVKLFGEEVQVNAHIEKMDGISGHADLGIMLDWLGNLKNTPEQVFVNHGDDTVCDEFAETIKNTLGFSASAPYNGAVYDLISGLCLEEGNKIRIRKEESAFGGKKISAIFENLLRAARRLMALVEKSSGLANKDIKKFTAEIDTLCDKWEK